MPEEIVIVSEWYEDQIVVRDSDGRKYRAHERGIQLTALAAS